MKKLSYVLAIMLVWINNIHGQTVATYSKNAYMSVAFLTQHEIDELLKDKKTETILINDTSILNTYSVERKGVEVIKSKSVNNYLGILEYCILYPKNCKTMRISAYGGEEGEKRADLLVECDVKKHQGVMLIIKRNSKSTKEVKMTSVLLDDEYSIFIATEDY